jgi:pimeloyl-ACP methyl ester carboxylesterase
MSATKADMLRVPGASLYYEVRGSGPLLLMIQGGSGNAGGTHGVASQLVDHYTVVTYDRRGLSRSTLDDVAESPPLETHSDDAHRLLAALTSEPALVFGASIGALIGLDLAARHPEQVRVLVAHEPPAPQLLPDAERARAERAQVDVEETYRREGAVAAMKKFVALSGVNFGDREPDFELPAPTSQTAADREFFLTHDASAARRYRLDIAALRAAPTRIVPAGGRTSRQYFPYICATALADRLGRQIVEFPGGHTGFLTHPRAFAATLRDVLDGAPDAGHWSPVVGHRGE